jgi:hypothetical protein
VVAGGDNGAAVSAGPTAVNGAGADICVGGARGVEMAGNDVDDAFVSSWNALAQRVAGFKSFTAGIVACALLVRYMVSLWPYSGVAAMHEALIRALVS